MGILFTVISAYFITRRFLIEGGIFLFIGAICDSFDGAVARKSGRVTKFGAFLDSSLDRISEIFIFFAIFFYFRFSHTAFSFTFEWITILTMGVSLLISYVKARVEGLGKNCKVGLLQRQYRLILLIFSIILSGLLNPYLSKSSSAKYLMDLPLKISLLFLLIGGIYTVAQRFNRAFEVLANKRR